MPTPHSLAAGSIEAYRNMMQRSGFLNWMNQVAAAYTERGVCLSGNTRAHRLAADIKQIPCINVAQCFGLAAPVFSNDG